MTHATVTRAVAGIDFTSAPTRRKPITVATGHSVAGVVKLERVHLLASFDTFATWLRTPGPWVAAIDMPFGLPRELVTALGWPADWAGSMTHYAGLTRAGIVETFAAFCDARPVGGKFAHRACDAHSGAHASMK